MYSGKFFESFCILEDTREEGKVKHKLIDIIFIVVSAVICGCNEWKEIMWWSSVESKIKDPNIIRLVKKMIKTGILEDYHFEPTEEGAGQGSVCSPIIANIYMHYVLIWWYKEVIKPVLKGYSGLIVYADDFVVCFQHKEDADRFLQDISITMA